MNMLEANMRKVSDSISNTVRLAAEFGDESLKDLKLYSSLVEKLCEIDSKMTSHRKAIAESYSEQTAESFNHCYESNLDRNKPDVRRHKRYKDFVQYAKPLLEPSLQGQSTQEQSNEDNDLVIEGNVGDMIDPILKRPLEVPVRNKQCNHIYEKHAIEELLRQNPRTRCPVMGCAAQGYIRKEMLEIDVRLQQQLLQSRSVFQS
uniref:E3 SUMO-protein ligase NSE2 n=1 Tax=Anopheles epiroticus TaxID=199890 RepID=A0A182PQJ1_9DIPT